MIVVPTIVCKENVGSVTRFSIESRKAKTKPITYISIKLLSQSQIVVNQNQNQSNCLISFDIIEDRSEIGVCLLVVRPV